MTIRTRKDKHSQPKKKLLAKLFFICFFLLGLSVLAFPLASQYLYYQAAQDKLSTFRQGVEELSDQEIEKRMSLARAYNEGLYFQSDQARDSLVDPYSNEEVEAGKREYARMLEVKEQIGYISIPKIGQELPIYAGTSEDILQKGVGHLEGTSLPVGGNNTHAVMTAHRGLPNARLFTDLDKVEVGDYFYMHNLSEVLAYQVDDIKTIEPSEIEHLKVFPGHDYMTLLTCTPYMINSHRLLVRGHQVPYDQAVEEKLISQSKSNNLYRNLFFITLAILLILLIYLFIGYLRKRKRKKQANRELANHD